MTEIKTYPVNEYFSDRGLINNDQYLDMYKNSVDNPEAFWAEQGHRIDWIKPFKKVKDVSFQHDDVHIRWYEDGSLNPTISCLDRHLADRGDQTAIIWEGDEPTDDAKITYRDLYQ